MANVKQVMIIGRVPFCLAENEEVCLKLGQINTPGNGLKISYSPDVVEWKPNKRGGDTAIYEFTFFGQEAVSIPWLQNFIDAFKEAGATIENAQVYDIEAQEEIKLNL